MKIKNKIIAIISAILIFLPVLCIFPVTASAADTSNLSTEEYYLTGGTGDYEGVEVNTLDESFGSSTYDYPLYKINFHLDYLNSWKTVVYDLTSPVSMFKLGFYKLYDSFNYSKSDPYYLFYYGVNKNDPSKVFFHIVLSESPMKFELKNSKYLLSSVSQMCSYSFNFGIGGLDSSLESGYYSYPSDITDIYNSTLFYSNGNPVAKDINIKEIYSNCPDMEVNGFNFHNEIVKNFKDQIDVKLTPTFGYDMDRVVDVSSGVNDYFTLEITNNSDSSIQWQAGIYDPSMLVPDAKHYLNADSTCWKYMCRETYYTTSSTEDKGIFRSTYTVKGVTRTGVLDYHLLKPHETFKEVIYWENIKIKANVAYCFFVSAIKTNLNLPTCSLSVGPYEYVPEKSDLHQVTITEESVKDIVLETDVDFTTYDGVIYDVEFSCKTMPPFTSVVRGGNSVANSTGADRFKQHMNYENQSNLDGSDTRVNKDYVDPVTISNTINNSDVNVDIDSFSIDDVKSYISSCQSFFILIKDALSSFPAFIWALICFGLTALIVIGIVKALL